MAFVCHTAGLWIADEWIPDNASRFRYGGVVVFVVCGTFERGLKANPDAQVYP
ncbi:hypothetical protein KIH87_07250 [Paraneptunicella aestuarii]|uniref:hypothetical protein n=1 Tax=Paraneptunicella aestuarii TaxID=2831148 RepID=UPI001E371639|nr:hypothetical protein [Paraneptunicella aestuarii]UAA40135.1 hypothetical protein KIH87_07250 [Paraneptunicella aestuarii]